MTDVTGIRIKKLREARNMTMQDLAEKIGVSKSMISYYESGKKKPSFKTIGKVAEALNVTADYLIGNSEAFNSDNTVSNDIKTFIDKFEKLDPAEREKILKILDMLAD